MIESKTNKNINNINALVDKAISEVKIANARAQSAENMLEVVKSTVKEEIEKAYQRGYMDAKNSIDSNDGGTSKTNDNVKLVLKGN